MNAFVQDSYLHRLSMQLQLSGESGFDTLTQMDVRALHRDSRKEFINKLGQRLCDTFGGIMQLNFGISEYAFLRVLPQPIVSAISHLEIPHRISRVLAKGIWRQKLVNHSVYYQSENTSYRILNQPARYLNTISLRSSHDTLRFVFVTSVHIGEYAANDIESLRSWCQNLFNSIEALSDSHKASTGLSKTFVDGQMSVILDNPPPATAFSELPFSSGSMGTLTKELCRSLDVILQTELINEQATAKILEQCEGLIRLNRRLMPATQRREVELLFGE